MADDKKLNRRDFIQNSMRTTLGIAVVGLGGLSMLRSKGENWVWQIDPFKCTWCGRCATSCVMTPSAVKCVNAYDLCGYCDLCTGYFKNGVKDLNTGAENLVCPTSAIVRKFIEEPYFQFDIVEKLCIGCGKCVKGCTQFGNGSFILQIRHDRCKNCNECAIARMCPSDAIKRVPANTPYMIKSDFIRK